jgi:ribosomal protein L3 glutamine methyltransferase
MVSMSWDLETAIADLRTIQDHYRFSLSRLSDSKLCFRNGMGSAEAETVFLLSTVLALDPEELDKQASAALLRAERRAILTALKERLNERRPMAYILNTTWYCGHKLYIDEGALIPRSAIGTMLNDYFTVFDGDSRHILDLGTGSGGIAIAFAHAFPKAQLWASELFLEALKVAQRNIADHGLQNRVTALRSDLFENLKDQSFDWILCNPPYVSEDFKEVMSTEASFEPEPALFGGENGFQLILPLLKQCPLYLKPGGQIFIEMGDITGQRFRQDYPKAGGEWYCHPESGQAVVYIMTRNEALAFSVL